MELKQGDLVIDYEGNLTLIVTNAKDELIPICLNNRSKGASYFNDIHPTILQFESDYKLIKGKPPVAISNISEVLKHHKNEIPK